MLPQKSLKIKLSEMLFSAISVIKKSFVVCILYSHAFNIDINIDLLFMMLLPISCYS